MNYTGLERRLGLTRVPDVVVALSLLLGGCGTDSRPTFTQRTDPDVVFREGSVAANLYFFDHPYTEAVVADLVERPALARAVEYLEARGYAGRAKWGNVVEGTARGEHRRVTFIAMRHRYRAADVVQLTCIETGATIQIVMNRFVRSSGAPDVMSREVTDGVWMGLVSPEMDGARISLQDIRNVYDCIYSTLGPEVAKCAFACYFTGPYLMQCAAICTGAEIVGRALDCWGNLANLHGKDRQQQ